MYVQFACSSEKKNARIIGYVLAGPYWRFTIPRSLFHVAWVSSGWTLNRSNPDCRPCRQEDQDHHDRDDDDVPPDADLVEQRDEVDAGDVHRQLDEQQHAHRDELAVEQVGDHLDVLNVPPNSRSTIVALMKPAAA